MTQDELLRRTVSILEEMGVTYMIVGSYASGTLGEPRFTQDIDIVVALIREDIPVLVRAFPESDYYLNDQSAYQALHDGSMFNVIHPESGNKIDFMIARTDLWGRHQIANRERIQITPDFEAYVGAPADIIISKLLYYERGRSPKHLRDIAGMLRVSGHRIDRDYVEHWTRELGVHEHWRGVVEQFDRDANDQQD